MHADAFNGKAPLLLHNGAQPEGSGSGCRSCVGSVTRWRRQSVWHTECCQHSLAKPSKQGGQDCKDAAGWVGLAL